MHDEPVRLSVVAPCYNEQQVLGAFHRRTTEACRRQACSYEIVLVDDGSSDETWSLMRQLSADDASVVAVKLSRNHGHQLALTAGLSVCRGERVMIIDADLQDPPELLGEMMKLMDDGADVVFGQRRHREGETWFKRTTASAFYRLIDWLSETPIPRDTGDFRLISRRALDVLRDMPERHRFVRGMVAWVGFKQVPLVYDRDARAEGQTKYPLRKMVRFALDGVTAFSVKPLRLAGYFGVLCAALALTLLVYALVGLLMDGTVRGWTSLMAAIALIGSAQLFVIGIMGEYLGRLYEQSKGRPLFIIEHVERRSADDR